MKQGEFEREFERRLEENRKLTGRPFLPERAFPIASFVSMHLFYVLLGISLLFAVVVFGTFRDELLGLSKVLLLLDL